MTSVSGSRARCVLCFVTCLVGNLLGQVKDPCPWLVLGRANLLHQSPVFTSKVKTMYVLGRPNEVSPGAGLFSFIICRDCTGLGCPAPVCSFTLLRTSFAQRDMQPFEAGLSSWEKMSLYKLTVQESTAHQPDLARPSCARVKSCVKTG